MDIEQVVAQAVAPFVETVGDAVDASVAMLAALEAAGYAIYRPEDCATVFVDSCHHGHDDCQWLEIPAPHSDPGPHSLVPVGGDS